MLLRRPQSIPTSLGVAALTVALAGLADVGLASAAARLSGASLLSSLRSENWNLVTERHLEQHPYVLAAEAGSLTLTQRRAFVFEQYYIQRSDAASFSLLAGHTGFAPPTLLGATVPQCKRCDSASSRLFQYLAEGEVYAFSLLMQQAQALGVDEAALAAHTPSEGASSYPRLWADMAYAGDRAAAAAAAAVNFPAWGLMCGRVRAALLSGAYGNVTEEEVAFLAYFAEPIGGLDAMSAAVIAEEAAERGLDRGRLYEAVQRQQAAEVDFWDSIY
jgi:pyrroloquinoline quinone (PQQ) biosynthesis protein C